MSPPRAVLIGGGARSGKSTLALQLALAVPGRRAFLATATASDGEMSDRIARHQLERGDLFETIEEPLAVPSVVAHHPADVLVVDCLTLWLSNLLMADRSDEAIEAEVDALVAALDARPRALTALVTNEVGLGIVPMSALARRFRDLTGRAHQRLAGRAEEVYLGAMGLMLRLKPGPVEALPRIAR